MELPALQARGRVLAQGGAFVLQLQITQRQRRAQRRLEASSCEELADAAAWLIVVGQVGEGAQRAAPGPPSLPVRASTPVDQATNAESTQRARVLDGVPAPARADAPAEPSNTVANGAEAAARSKLDAFSSRTDAPRTDREARDDARPAGAGRHGNDARWARVGLSSGVFSGALPAPQALVGVGGGLGYGILYAELRFLHVFERSRGFASVADERRASFYSDQLGALACSLFDFARDRLRAGPCLHVFATRTSGEALGTTQPKSRAHFWALGGASAQLAFALFGPLELVVEGGASLPLSRRPRFFVRAGEREVAVTRAASVSGYGTLALGARW